MNIGAIIKKLRREKEMTQETLAEYLGVSVSAVSQWESEKTMPDLSLIAPLCNLLGVTSDELLGINLAQKQQKIDAICEEADSYSTRGYDMQAYRVLKEGLRAYPDSYEIMWRLMDAAFYLRSDKTQTEQARGEFTDEAVRLGEQILEKCLDDGTRHHTIQTLCFIYPAIGKRERAAELAQNMPTIPCSRDFLLMSVYDGDAGDRRVKRCRFDLLQFLASSITATPKKLDNGERAYSKDEMAILRDKQIALFELMFEQGDFGSFHGHLATTHASQASYYAEAQDAERTLAHLTKAAEHAVAFVQLLEHDEGDRNDEYTSLLFRGLYAGKGGVSVSYTENDAMLLLKRMQKPAFDFVRDTAAFAEIAEGLEKYAKKWEPAE